MLIINNGVPKSGSSWVQRAISKAASPRRPQAHWLDPKWHNPSIKMPLLSDYVKSGDWQDGVVLVKMHFVFRQDLRYVVADGVKVVVSYGNLVDSVFSFFYHQVRQGRATPAESSIWYETAGIQLAQQALRHRQSWANVENARLVRYENMVENAETVFAICLRGLILGSLPKSSAPSARQPKSGSVKAKRRETASMSGRLDEASQVKTCPLPSIRR